MKADRRHIFPKKALSIEGVKTKTLIIAISQQRKSMTYYLINNRAVSVELTNISLYFWNHILLWDFIALWIEIGIMILHIKQCMSAHKVVHDFEIDPLKRIRFFAARSRGRKSSWAEPLPRSELVWNFIWSWIGFFVRIVRLLNLRLNSIAHRSLESQRPLRWFMLLFSFDPAKRDKDAGKQ